MSEREIEDYLRECCQEADVTLVGFEAYSVAMHCTVLFLDWTLAIPAGVNYAFRLRSELGEKTHVFTYHTGEEGRLRLLIRNTVFDWTSSAGRHGYGL